MTANPIIQPSQLLHIHDQIRIQGQPLVTILTDHQRLDAKVFFYQQATQRGIPIMRAPTLDPDLVLKCFHHSQKNAQKSYIALHFDLATALVLSDELHALDASLPIVTFSDSAKIIETLFRQDLTSERLKKILQGLVPIGVEQQSIFQTLTGEQRLKPLLRSAYEGLLYYILEARPETRGYFRANQRITASSEKSAKRFEVDLVSIEHRLIIEIDGQQHSAPEQTKRDQIKANALKKRGFRFIRFTTEKIAQQPDAVWQAIDQIIHPNGEKKHGNTP
ncbi:endonuclease domain-containing protein [Rhabdochromatium marinum]|uniref:endonuclease domain-containing protein n=1 Tax=Rhabdochromatium marinum TaxID=48729 RepID=UPI0019047BDC|nr:DUF559 domain-containing protein [Rhabdochromatium marinum]MBK1649430.1 hypothetical protein [Rhabdochromatium marinum]